MACSLNGLSVGETLTENLMDSPARSDTSMCYHTRDELASQYSPMSEDSDDTRCYDPHFNTMAAQPDGTGSISSSPVSPHRCPRHQMVSAPSATYPLVATVCSHPRRGADTDARFPSSPNDSCHTGDLRRTALLRSVQMRAQPHGSPPAYELSFTGMASAEEGDRPCSCLKNADDEPEYHRPPPQFPGLLEEALKQMGLPPLTKVDPSEW
ncbi:unnamed protein product [Spirodela intermedia]|uniref:Uncharacterized protein n=1 Tax=Spirodela intermedia TaxID=51605 RepID=A0A7I8JG75_SPIIN|nr:unnamed protein product [Spirodela intermedia]CAA6669154.1 unnamed protein product [Spirodela intermedia]